MKKKYIYLIGILVVICLVIFVVLYNKGDSVKVYDKYSARIGIMYDGDSYSRSFDIFRKKKRIPAPWKKYYSSDELNIKIPNITMYDQVRESSLKYGDLVAVEYLGKKIKYRKFIKLIDRACNSFYKMGVRKGDNRFH